ncbi:tRNA glutamyl-Q(34) synthetase GluQRS [Arsenicitalea aurantiaca]|uniref:tRNA glutamyl-Q(34) synthetase GluQRS n=1 Tax=Arsenicitalea aurantiaca TaxID=1783274 RepID=A0A433X5R2_9HYPH|nr:tRNA glutamyl-Q(34) synthetase GluQRS [Arsenicitalea aurantiaca]RUT29403.1 tRNA glutamyl-Q(34) synthetase GluQRS [Arsenicitalea aurantiaca]
MASSLAHRPRLRFAPSPNGRLHLGHAFSALLTFGAAEALGGEALLRIEDIDISRCKPEFTRAIFEDLAWLGLRWPEPVLVQSTRFAAYRAAAEALERRGLLYPCFCSRREVAADATHVDPDGGPRYGGRCRHLAQGDRDRAIAAGAPHLFRLDMARAIAEAGRPEIPEAEILPDHRLGSPTLRASDPARWGDVVLVRRDIPTSYHLAAVLDDAHQGITHVTRGADLLAATDIHVLLQRLLDLPHPVYAHHGLVRDAGAEKLAKSRGSESLADLRARGWTPADIRARLGFG